MNVLMIDNYDSFTFNIVQYLGELGAEVETIRNDTLTIEEIEQRDFTHLMISPGPCSPSEAGISLDLIRHFAGRVPIFGICLGFQAIGQAYGGEVIRAPMVMHGKTSLIDHDGRGAFEGLENPLEVTRYHSLILERETLPECFEITSATVSDDVTPGIVMGIRHRTLDMEGVLFHPESILSRQGHELLANFLKRQPQDAPRGAAVEA
ncbi:aminodeoxychorismate/anthranilate synthase component II [Kushneria sp. AK178]